MKGNIMRNFRALIYTAALASVGTLGITCAIAQIPINQTPPDQIQQGANQVILDTDPNGITLGNVYRSGMQVSVENGIVKLVPKGSQPPAVWVLERFTGPMYAFRNKADGTYLYRENFGPITTRRVDPRTDYSARWLVFRVPARPSSYQIFTQNDMVIHTETGALDVWAKGRIPDNYATAWWSFDPAPASAIAPSARPPAAPTGVVVAQPTPRPFPDDTAILRRPSTTPSTSPAPPSDPYATRNRTSDNFPGTPPATPPNRPTVSQPSWQGSQGNTTTARPTTTGDSYATRNRTLDEIEKTRAAPAPCLPTRICWVQIRGVKVEKRTEISDDEVYGLVTSIIPRLTADRYPASGTEPREKLGTWADIFYTDTRSVHSVVAMNEEKSHLKYWEICHKQMLVGPIAFHLTESDKTTYSDSDNSGPDKDDEIGSVTITSSLPQGVYSHEFQPEGGGKYAVLYELAESEAKLKPCAPSGPRDPQRNPEVVAGPQSAGQSSGGGGGTSVDNSLDYRCEEFADKSTGGGGAPSTTQVALAQWLVYGLCHANGGPF
jgi:hypothetical protein